MTNTEHISSHTIRTWFSQAMSDMYRTEVPSYGDLVALVEKVNQSHLEAHPSLKAQLCRNQELDRLNLERHGAVRVGTAEELSFLRRIFAIMGMYPVGYYDLSVAGIPVHSTAFRPVGSESLRRNPFRLFTSLLRLDLISDSKLREASEQLLTRRDIFTSRARELVLTAESQGGLTRGQAREFTYEIVETFRWHEQATVDYKTYQALRKEHPLIADVVCFKGPHINHLTPRTLDIDRVQDELKRIGVVPKDRIEGPPPRKNPILLRQTSYKALEEPITFTDGYRGTHTARFGEIETRGMALTPKGRALYDQLLSEALTQAEHSSPARFEECLKKVFTAFPDDIEVIRHEGLAYFTYDWVQNAANDAHRNDSKSLSELVAAGDVIATPIAYEDFLPVSAAGIFRSNLGDKDDQNYMATSNQVVFEEALGAEVLDEFDLYSAMETASKAKLWE